MTTLPLTTDVTPTMCGCTATNASDYKEGARLLGRINFSVDAKCKPRLPIELSKYVASGDGLHSVLVESPPSVHIIVKPRFTEYVRLDFSIGLTRQTVSCLFEDFIRRNNPVVDGRFATIMFSHDSEHLTDYVWELLTNAGNSELLNKTEYSIAGSDDPWSRIGTLNVKPHMSLPSLEVFDDSTLAFLIRDELDIFYRKDRYGKQAQLVEAYRGMCEATRAVDTSTSDLTLGAALWDRNQAVRKYERVCASCVDVSGIDTITFLGKTIHV